MSVAKSSTAIDAGLKERPSLSTIIQGRYYLRPRQPRTRPFERLYRKQNETTDDHLIADSRHASASDQIGRYQLFHGVSAETEYGKEHCAYFGAIATQIHRRG
jgi:hypothetical protein